MGPRRRYISAAIPSQYDWVLNTRWERVYSDASTQTRRVVAYTPRIWRGGWL